MHEQVVAIVTGPVMVAWALTAVLVAGLLGATAARSSRGELLALGALLLGGLALRVALASWGPGDFNVIAFNVLSKRHAVDALHGIAPDILWSALFTVLPRSDTTLVVISLLLGALAPVLLVPCLRELGATRLAAFGAAVVLAFHPVLVRYSGDAGRTILVLFLSIAALWAAFRVAKARRLRDKLLFVTSALLCCFTRPEAGMVLVMIGLALFLFRDQAAVPYARAAAWLLLAVGAVAGANIVAVGSGAEENQKLFYDLTVNLRSWLNYANWYWLLPVYTQIVATAAALFGLVTGLRARDRLATWATVALVVQGCACGNIGTSYDSANGLMLSNMRYYPLVLLSFAILAGWGLSEGAAVVERRFGASARRRGLVLLAGLFVVASPLPLAKVCGLRTIDYEYRYLREVLPRLPADAVIYAVATHGFIGGLTNAHGFAGFLGPDDWRPWPPAAHAPGDRPEYFYESPSCHLSPTAMAVATLDQEAERLRATCREALSHVDEASSLTTEIPAAPYGYEGFESASMRIGFLRLRRGPQGSTAE